MPAWRAPYCTIRHNCGIQHLNGVAPGWQVVVDEHPDGSSEAYVLEGLWTRSVSRHPTVKKARAWAEAEAQRLRILKAEGRA